LTFFNPQVLIPPKDLMAKLKLESENPKEIVKLVQNRVLWAKHKEQEKRKEQEVKEKERGKFTIYQHCGKI